MTRTLPLVRTAVATAFLASAALVATTGHADAASSDGCTGGGFSLVNLTTDTVVARAGEDRVRTTLSARSLGDEFGVRGKYVQFDVRSSDFAVLDQAFTGAPNELDITGEEFTPVFASRVPDHRGATLEGGIAVRLDEEVLLSCS